MILVFTCPKCGYTEGQEAKQTKKIVEEPVEESILAFEGNEGEESHPTIKIECEKCGHDEAIWWMLQTRSADETYNPILPLYKMSVYLA